MPVMNMISLPGGAEFLIIGILLFYFVVVIGTIVRIWARPDLEVQTRLLWTLLTLVAPLLGVILYHIFGRQPAR